MNLIYLDNDDYLNRFTDKSYIFILSKTFTDQDIINYMSKLIHEDIDVTLPFYTSPYLNEMKQNYFIRIAQEHWDTHTGKTIGTNWPYID